MNAPKATPHLGYRLGHTALAIQVSYNKRLWQYITFTKTGVKDNHCYMLDSKVNIKNHSAVMSSIVKKINNKERIAFKAAAYVHSLYISGNFTHNKNWDKKYNNITNNCSQRSIKVLLRGKFSGNDWAKRVVFSAQLAQPYPNLAFLQLKALKVAASFVKF